MFENKKVNIILSFIVAITLWIYVIGETNPQDSKTFREIPINYINEQVLSDNGLAVVSVSDKTFTVTVSGSRANVNELTEKDITATVNLADASKGKNQLKLSVQVPDNLEIKDKNLSKVVVEVEQKESRQVDVVPEYKGAFSDEEEPITVGLDVETVTVTGAASQVEKVQSVKAVVKPDSVTHKLGTFACRLIAVDRSGLQVENVKLSHESAVVTAQLAKTKTVNLRVPIIDRTANNIEKDVSVPKTIIIKGKSEDLDGVDTIETLSVDLSNLTESTVLHLEPILPDGVQISVKSINTLKMKVEVSEVAHKTLNFTQDDIEIQGLAEGFDANLQSEKIKISVEGAKKLIDQVENKDFSLVVSADEMEAGTYQAELIITCSKKHIIFHADIDKINITIEEKR